VVRFNIRRRAARSHVNVRIKGLLANILPGGGRGGAMTLTALR
jgi:hypothetical protein